MDIWNEILSVGTLALYLLGRFLSVKFYEKEIYIALKIGSEMMLVFREDTRQNGTQRMLENQK